MSLGFRRIFLVDQKISLLILYGPYGPSSTRLVQSNCIPMPSRLVYLGYRSQSKFLRFVRQTQAARVETSRMVICIATCQRPIILSRRIRIDSDAKHGGASLDLAACRCISYNILSRAFRALLQDLLEWSTPSLLCPTSSASLQP